MRGHKGMSKQIKGKMFSRDSYGTVSASLKKTTCPRLNALEKEKTIEGTLAKAKKLCPENVESGFNMS